MRVDLFGNTIDDFINAKERYGVWPTTVWDCDKSDPTRIALKKLIGDEAQSRENLNTFMESGKNSCYRGENGVYTSIFDPAIASWILNAYAPKKGICFDPFAGGGTRAIMAAKHGLQYVGVELRKEEISSVEARCSNAEVQARIIEGDSRSVPEIPDNYADFLITCPPYFNLEQYNGGEADLSMAPDYLHFMAGMFAVIKESSRILKRGALSCWVIGLHRTDTGELLPMHHDIARIHKNLSFFFKEEIILAHRNNGAIQRVGNFEKGNRHLIRTHEYVLVFRKGLGKP